MDYPVCPASDNRDQDTFQSSKTSSCQGGPTACDWHSSISPTLIRFGPIQGRLFEAGLDTYLRLLAYLGLWAMDLVVGILEVCEDSELVRRRGRWLNSRAMEIYIQERSALQFLPSLSSKTRDRILQAVIVFPQALEKFLTFETLCFPTNAWHLLLCSDA